MKSTTGTKTDDAGRVVIARGTNVKVLAMPDRSTFSRRGHKYHVTGGNLTYSFREFGKAFAAAERSDPDQVDYIDMTDAEVEIAEQLDADAFKAAADGN